MKKNLRKLTLTVTWLTVSVLALAALFFLTAPLWQQRWIEPRPRVDWSPSAPPLQESDIQSGDAYDLLRQAAALYQENTAADLKNHASSRSLSLEQARLVLNKEKFAPEKFPHTVAWLAQNTAALDLLRQVPAAPNQRIPTPPVSLTRQETNIISAVLRLNELLSLAAEQRAAGGDWRGALDDINAGLTVSALLTRGGVFIHALVNYHSSRQLLERLHRLTVSGSVPVNLLKQEISALENFEKNAVPFGEILRADFAFGDAYVDQLWNARSTLPLLHNIGELKFYPRQPWKTNLQVLQITAVHHLQFYAGQMLGSGKETVRENKNFFDQATLELFMQPYRRSQFAEWQRQWKTPSLSAGLFPLTLRDPLGYMLCRVIAAPGMSGSYLACLDHQRLLRAAQVSLAVSAFKQERGTLPLTLSELAPNYLPEIPSDPFDEPQPLRYQTTADGDWLIYSVGPDQKDDHGRPTHRNRATLDADGDLILSSAPKPEPQRP